MAVDFKSLGKFEQGALIAGGLSLILSFIPSFVTGSYDGPGSDIPGVDASTGTSAWVSYATLGVLLLIAATAVIAVKAFAKDQLPAGVPWNLVAFALAALGALLVVLRGLTSYESGSGFSVGPGWSGYALFITSIALAVFAFLSFRASGEKMPEANRNNKTPPAPPAA